MSLRPLAASILIFPALVYAQAPADPLGFEARVRPILKQHCYQCHSGEKAKADLDFSKMKTTEQVLGDITKWRQIRDAIEFDDMPPKPKESGWTEADKDKVLAWIQTTIENPDAGNALFRNPGPPYLRQLNITEYTRTVRDLLGISVNISDLTGIYPEPPVTGYSTFARGLTMDTLQFENFFKASQIVIGQLFSDEAQPWAKAPDRDARKQEAQAALAKLLDPAKGKSGPEAARAVLLNLVSRAYRRPIQPREIARFQALYQESLAGGASQTEALRKAIIPVLVSPSFIYRFEFNPPDIPAGLTAHRITDFELATRLSYFLWSSMPDDTLYQLAANRQLSNPKVYREQVLRMLKDPRASALSEIFASEWTKLSRLKDALPSPELYPEFTDALKTSMRGELIAFFNDLRVNNKSVLNLIDSNYTFVDANLAKFYGLAGNFGSDYKFVALTPSANRGGLLGMGAILAKTSHVDRTKPTTRGDWVLGTLLGEPPPPPPANAGQFAENDPNRPPPKNFREKLERHSSDPSCAGCHKKIDPLGFAMENFDPIGRWRDKEPGGEPLDNQGALPGGKKLDGVKGLKAVLQERKDDFAKNLFGQMLSYALGRELQYYDRPVINQALAEIRRQNYSFHSVVLAVAESYPFKNRSIAVNRGPTTAQVTSAP